MHAVMLSIRLTQDMLQEYMLAGPMSSTTIVAIESETRMPEIHDCHEWIQPFPGVLQENT